MYLTKTKLQAVKRVVISPGIGDADPRTDRRDSIPSSGEEQDEAPTDDAAGHPDAPMS